MPPFTNSNQQMNTADLIGISGVVCYQIAYAGLQLGFLQRENAKAVIATASTGVTATGRECEFADAVS